VASGEGERGGIASLPIFFFYLRIVLFWLLVEEGIATRYGLNGPGSNPGGGEIFRTRPDRLWGLPSLLCKGYPVFSGGKAPGGMALTTRPHLAPRLKKEQSYTSAPPLSLRGLF
jgi:hypothetical protein